MKRFKIFCDRAAHVFTGALAIAFIWFISVEHECSKPHALGYNACDRAEMDMLVMELQDLDMSNVRPLRMSDLELVK